jgi:hypothetical protein
MISVSLIPASDRICLASQTLDGSSGCRKIQQMTLGKINTLLVAGIR